MDITTDELAQRIAIMAVCWAGSSANRRQAAPAVALRGIDQYEEEHAMPTTHRLDGDPRTDHDTNTCQARGCGTKPAGHEDWIATPVRNQRCDDGSIWTWVGLAAASALSHEHLHQGQTLAHTHTGGSTPHGYYEHTEDGHPYPVGDQGTTHRPGLALARDHHHGGHAHTVADLVGVPDFTALQQMVNAAVRKALVVEAEIADDEGCYESDDGYRPDPYPVLRTCRECGGAERHGRGCSILTSTERKVTAGYVQGIRGAAARIARMGNDKDNHTPAYRFAESVLAELAQTSTPERSCHHGCGKLAELWDDKGQGWCLTHAPHLYNHDG